ncbi:MAG: pyridoxal 5'-phosphate synthase glutaminase subunit PdxT [Candidatus Neomarinimicrobiota bacterium]|nr:MAG: pyridoxal 5'-phosphate synthase glutaminase subunit PdxT [Candidatus Neomarinimicrobiota bacterium]
MKIGVLALQGDFMKHGKILAELGARPVWIRYPRDLEAVEGLVLPGGESTTMSKLLTRNQLREPIHRFAATYPVLGTCAGMILMARRVDDPRVEPLELVDMDVTRNAYGRQVHSFTDRLELRNHHAGPVSGVFIRAPKIVRLGTPVQVWAVYEEAPVAVQDGRHVALSFHPELNGELYFHQRTFFPAHD